MPDTHLKRPAHGKANPLYLSKHGNADARDGTVPKAARHVRLSDQLARSAKRIGTDKHDLLRVLARARLKPALPSKRVPVGTPWVTASVFPNSPSGQIRG